MAYAPVLSASLDAAPSPRVEVLFSSLHPSAATLTVFRAAGGRTYPIRGGVRVATAGAFTRIDMEVPFGVPVTYYAEMFDAAGLSLGVTDSASVTVWCDDTWVHNPLSPAGAVRVQFRGNAARKIDRPTNAEVVFPLGRRVGVIVGNGRQGIRDVVLDVVTDTLEDADRMADLLGGYDRETTPVLCFRVGASDRIRLPRPFFVGVEGSASEEDLNYVLGGETITHPLQGSEVSPPSPGIFIPFLTNADINAFYASNAAINAAHSTNLSINRNYQIAGTAS